MIYRHFYCVRLRRDAESTHSRAGVVRDTALWRAAARSQPVATVGSRRCVFIDDIIKPVNAKRRIFRHEHCQRIFTLLDGTLDVAQTIVSFRRDLPQETR